jgi:hypothetical protein
MNLTILPSTNAHSANEVQDETQLVDDAVPGPQDSISEAREKTRGIAKYFAPADRQPVALSGAPE